MSAAAPASSFERARLTVRCGPLGRAMASRFVSALAAETTLAVDRIDEACLIAEAVADRCGELTPDGELSLAVTVHADRLEVRLGPLEPGAVERLLQSDARRDGGGAIRGLASQVDVVPRRDGEATLRVLIAAHPPR